LNNKLEAFLSDFGTAKLLDSDSSNQTLVAGTYGYIAPGKFLFPCYNLYLYSFSVLFVIVKHRTSHICKTNIFLQYLYCRVTLSFTISID